MAVRERRRRRQRAKVRLLLERKPNIVALVEELAEREGVSIKEAVELVARELAPHDYSQYTWWCPECEHSLTDADLVWDEGKRAWVCPNCFSKPRRRRIGHVIRDYITELWREVGGP